MPDIDHDHTKLPRSFYLEDDVVEISRQLIGKVLCTRIDDAPLTSGIIVETEAYAAYNDKACHANNDNKTGRTRVMFEKGGHAYVYLCYGIHRLFNVVTNRKGMAEAVLIRAIEPLDGINTILNRRNQQRSSPKLTAGPGRLTAALGIELEHYGLDLTGDTIWIEDRKIAVSANDIASSPRIGVDYAGEHASRPWRFTLKESEWVSR